MSAHFPRITKHDLEVVVEAMDRLREALRATPSDSTALARQLEEARYEGAAAAYFWHRSEHIEKPVIEGIEMPDVENCEWCKTIEAAKLAARAQALEEAADECDGAQIEAYKEGFGFSKEQLRQWNEWICGVGDKIRALPSDPTALAKPAQQCHAGSDGDCFWSECPQEANNRANYQVECPLSVAARVAELKREK